MLVLSRSSCCGLSSYPSDKSIVNSDTENQVGSSGSVEAVERVRSLRLAAAAAGAGILLREVGRGAGEKLAWIFAGMVVVEVVLVAVILFCRVKMLRIMLSCGSDDEAVERVRSLLQRCNLALSGAGAGILSDGGGGGEACLDLLRRYGGVGCVVAGGGDLVVLWFR